MTDVLSWVVVSLNLAIVVLYLNLWFAWRRRMKRERAEFARLTAALELLVSRYNNVLTRLEEK